MKLWIQNGWALLPGENGPEAKQADLYIDGDRIVGVGQAPEGFQPDRTLAAADKLVIPGLINCHTHNYMTLFRNSADDVPFEEWLFRRVMPREDRMTPEDAYWGAMLGICLLYTSRCV